MVGAALAASGLQRESKGDLIGDVKIDPAAVASLHLRHAEELRYFILGVIRDRELTEEVVQTAFTKAIELGHTVKQESLKAWLFRVAYNEALALRRRQAVGDKVVRFIAAQPFAHEPLPEAGLVRKETVQNVRAALAELPPEQRRVVALRIYDGRRFAEIAQELGLPLGTVLSRMQAALGKLRKSLSDDE
jgi:RNA polymerase sigma-70 factor (ECF subfamily)